MLRKQPNENTKQLTWYLISEEFLIERPRLFSDHVKISQGASIMWPLLPVLLLLSVVLYGSKRDREDERISNAPAAKRCNRRTNLEPSSGDARMIHVDDDLDSLNGAVSEVMENLPKNGLHLTHRQKKRLVNNMLDESFKKGFTTGSVFYLVSTKWIKEWNRCRDSVSLYKPIDNGHLIDWDKHRLLPGHLVPIIEESELDEDYRPIPESLWNQLRNWYGAREPIIRRRMYEYPQGSFNYGSHLAQIEFEYIQESIHEVIHVSHLDTVKDLKILIRTSISAIIPGLQLPGTLYFCYRPRNSATDYALKEDLDDLTVIELDLDTTDCLIFVSSYPFTKVFSRDFETTTAIVQRVDGGLVGLRNIGNTCYMNSALQCLFQCIPFRDLVLSTESTQVNAASSRKSVQALLYHFQILLQNAWTARPGSVLDTATFKYWLNHFAPQFMELQQHDSQEFLSVVLDLLSKGTEERSGGEIFADSFLNLHDTYSSIHDVFRGQFKSTLTCSKCKRSSIANESFVFLSLPVPTSSAFTLNILIQSHRHVGEVELFFDGKSAMNVGSLRQAVLDKLGLSSQEYCVGLIESTDDAYWDIILSNELPLSALSNRKVQAGVVAHGRCTWMRLIVDRTYIGFPLLVPTNKPSLLKCLIDFSRNSGLRVENFELLNIGHQGTCIRVDKNLYSMFVNNSGEISLAERHMKAFKNMFLSMHEVIIPLEPPRTLVSEKLTLNRALEYFLAEEVLEEAESWHCPHCNMKWAGTKKKLDIFKFPEVLIVHLKRFESNMKQDIAVEFPAR